LGTIEGIDSGGLTVKLGGDGDKHVTVDIESIQHLDYD
jgi:hypothetical protein